MLGPSISAEHFLASDWQQRPLFISGGGGGGGGSPEQRERVSRIRRLLSMGSLEALINSPGFNHQMRKAAQQIAEGGLHSQSHWWEAGALEPLSAHGLGFAPKSLQVVGSLQRARQPGEPPADYHDVHEAYLDGATVNLNTLEHIWAPIDALCNGLMRDLEWIFTVNAFITPRQAKVSRPHIDHQDVFILQVDGTKAWTVYHRPIRDALQEHKVGVPGSEDPTGLVGWDVVPAWQGQLQPGDLLYIPRGWVHDAETAQAGPSMHLTVAANTNGHSSGVFIKHMLDSVEGPGHDKASLDRQLRQLHMQTAILWRPESGCQREASSSGY
eukprot:SAG22_NODE_292_length_12914_cov_41.306594_8_plen_327_part_00